MAEESVKSEDNTALRERGMPPRITMLKVVFLGLSIDTTLGLMGWVAVVFRRTMLSFGFPSQNP